jgi:dipeptidyl aminopeptidase/acylaminoacyl peptidase
MSPVSAALPDIHPTLEHLRAHDGLQITGWLYRADPARHPQPALLIHLHGGPESQERPAWNPLFQALASAGISVFAPNIRGSSGFGRSFMTADDRDKRWDAIRDVVACAEFVLQRGLTTPERLACGGRSYGGYLTFAMLAFHPQLFAAGVAVCGMSDLHTFYQHTEPSIAEAAHLKYGHPVHDAELLRLLSPLHKFEQLRAPLLVVHGENDSNVPVQESNQAVARARALGIAVEYLLYAGEGHELAQSKHREHFVRATVTWLKQTLYQ